MTSGCAPTDSTSCVTAGSALVSTQGASLKMEASAASMPAASLPHIGWPPTRSIPDVDAHSMTLPFVLAISVTTLPATMPPRPANTWRRARIGTASTTMSAISTTARSALAVATMPRSTALRRVSGSGSLPTTTTSGRASLRASARDEPIRPRPTTATAGIPAAELGELLGHRAQQPAEVVHQAIEVLEVERLRAVREGLVGGWMHLDEQPVRPGCDRREGHG